MTADTLTVVLARPTSFAPTVRDALEGWTQAGLIEPLLWTVMGGAGPTSTAWLGGGSAEVDLRTVIAAEPYRLIRLIACHVLDDAEASADGTAAEFVQHAGKVQDAVARALAPQQRLVRLNLLIPTSGAAHISPETLSLHAEAHVLVAPEQRITPLHASVEVGDVDLVPHAAAAIASVSGRWRAPEVGPFDVEPHQGSSSNPQVTVVRSFARALRIRGALGDVANELFARRRSEAWAAHAAAATPARDPQGVVGTLLRDFLAAYGKLLTYQPGPAPIRPQPEVVRLWPATLELLRYVARGFRDLPADLASRVGASARQHMSDFARRAAAEPPAVAVGFGGRPDHPQPVDTAGRVADATEAATELARGLLHQASGEAPSPPPGGKTWQALRRMSFGAVDGSSMPKGITDPSDGTDRVVLSSAADVAPDPQAGAFRFSGVPSSLAHESLLQAPIGVCDAFQASHARALLDTCSARQPAAKGVEQREEVPGEAAPPGAEEPLPEDVARLRRQLDGWVAERERSLLWKLASRVSDALTDGREDLLGSLKRVRQGEPRVDEPALEAAQSDLRRQWLVITLAIVALGALTVWVLGGDGANVTPAGVALTVTGWILVWAVGLVIAFTRYQRRLSHLEYEYQRHHAEYLDAFERSLDAARQVDSLASMYRQLRGWAEAIGWMLHHPEGPVVQPPPATAPSAEVDTPPSVVVSEGLASESSLRRVGAIVGRELFRRGWILDLYMRYRDEAIERMKYEQGLSGDDPDPDLDRDLAPPTPLDYLLEDLRTGKSARAWTQGVLDELARAMHELAPAEIVVTVGGDGKAAVDADTFLAEVVPERSSPEPDHLFLPMWTAKARQREAHRVSASVVWAPVGLNVDEDHDVKRLQADPAPTFGGVFVLQCVRLDMTDPARADDVVLFGRRTQAGDARVAPDLADTTRELADKAR